MSTVVAYILIVTEIGKEHMVKNELMKIKRITEVRDVYGEYDIVARLESEDLRALDEMITQIRRIPNITRTVTLVST